MDHKQNKYIKYTVYSDDGKGGSKPGNRNSNLGRDVFVETLETMIREGLVDIGVKGYRW